MLYCIVLYHIIVSYCVTSHHFTLYHINYHLTSYCSISCTTYLISSSPHVVPNCITTCHITSHPIVSHHIVSNWTVLHWVVSHLIVSWAGLDPSASWFWPTGRMFDTPASDHLAVFSCSCCCLKVSTQELFVSYRHPNWTPSDKNLGR